MRVLKRMKEALRRWLEKMAKENEKQFGSAPPDCYNLAKKQEDQTRHE